jgi:MFS family permease
MLWALQDQYYGIGTFRSVFLITGHTQNIYVIYLMRIVQEYCPDWSLSKRAFFVDVYDGEERKHYLSIMTIVWSLGPIIAPFIGGYLQKSFGWQSNFTVLAGYSLIILDSGTCIFRRDH